MISAGLYLLLGIDILAISASLLLGASLASRLLAKAALRGLRLDISTKQVRSRSGEPVSAQLLLSNRNRVLPLFYPTVSVREAQTLSVQSFQYAGIITPKSSITLDIHSALENRGLRRLEVFGPRSHFPFGLHQATKEHSALSPEIIVWPRPAPIDVASILNEPPSHSYQTAGDHTLRSDDTEATRIRDYRIGDPKPLINWKLTAKLDKLTVIEPKDQTQERYELRLDTSSKLWPSPLAFERMISLVSAIVSEFLRRRCLQGVAIDDCHYSLSDPRQISQFFDRLALLQASHQCPFPEFPPACRNRLWILPSPNTGITLRSQPLEDILLVE